MAPRYRFVSTKKYYTEYFTLNIFYAFHISLHTAHFYFTFLKKCVKVDNSIILYSCKHLLSIDTPIDGKTRTKRIVASKEKVENRFGSTVAAGVITHSSDR